MSQTWCNGPLGMPSAMLAMSAVAAHVLALLPCGALALVATRPLSRAPRVPLRSPPASLVVSDLRTRTSTPSAAKDGSPSSWLDLWIPVCFTAAIPEDGLLPATIFERPLVLFRDQDAVHCLADQCPHRLAPLSDGRLTTDETGARRVECSYHGWHFSGCGRCTKLPQLEAGKPILPLYDAARHPVTESQGIVYVWLGDRDKAASTAVPRVPELDDESWMYEQDYMRDLPYDYTTLVENIIDPSHVPVSHHGTTQGNRALAQPLTITHGVPNGTWPLGFAGETEVPLHGSNRLGFTQQKAVQRVAFTAPSLLTYSFSVAAGDACASAPPRATNLPKAFPFSNARRGALDATPHPCAQSSIPSRSPVAVRASSCVALATSPRAAEWAAQPSWRSTSRTMSSSTKTWPSYAGRRRVCRRAGPTAGEAPGVRGRTRPKGAAAAT